MTSSRWRRAGPEQSTWSAIRRHTRECGGSACRAFLVALSNAEPTPAAQPSVRDAAPSDLHPKAKALAERWLASFGWALIPDGFYKPAVAMGPGQRRAAHAGHEEGAERTAWFGAAVRLISGGQQPDRVRIEINFDRLKGIRSGTVVVFVLLEDGGEPLAEVRLSDPWVSRAPCCPFRRDSSRPGTRASQSASCGAKPPPWRSRFYSGSTPRPAAPPEA